MLAEERGQPTPAPERRLLPHHQYVTTEITHLSSCVDDLRGEFLVLKLDDLGESVLDRGIVALDKMPVDELHRERGFAWRGRHTQVSPTKQTPRR